MNHISIEGMDGVGKSTTCKLLADKLGYIFVEKPLHFLFDDSDEDITQYQKVANRVNSNGNRNFTAWYWGLNNIYLYEKFKDKNIVIDIHTVSNNESDIFNKVLIKRMEKGGANFVCLN